MNELMTHENEWVHFFDTTLDRMLAELDRLSRESRPIQAFGHSLTEQHVTTKRKISRRTLQDYRNLGKLPYIQLGGKLLYRESDLEKMLQDGYRPAFT